MSAQAFVDESGRGASYYVCAVVVLNEDTQVLRRLARAHCLPGQRRWHFTQERSGRRRQIIEEIAATGLGAALIFHGTGNEAAIRAESLRQMIDPMIDRGVTRLIIESREGRDHLDRRVLVGELRQRHRAFDYDHLPAHSDPLLWVADAVAWCSSAGGAWRERIEPMVAVSRNVTRP